MPARQLAAPRHNPPAQCPQWVGSGRSATGGKRTFPSAGEPAMGVQRAAFGWISRNDVKRRSPQSATISPSSNIFSGFATRSWRVSTHPIHPNPDPKGRHKCPPIGNSPAPSGSNASSPQLREPALRSARSRSTRIRSPSTPEILPTSRRKRLWKLSEGVETDRVRRVRGESDAQPTKSKR